VLEGSAAVAAERSSEPAALLDERVRRRTVRASAASPGRYLELASAGEPLLFALEREVTHIGRGFAADLRFDDERVSRRHAILTARGDRTVLLDDRSLHGTFVNGRRIERTELHDGDVIRVGPVLLGFVDTRSDAPQAAAPGEPAARRCERAFDGWLAGRMRARARDRRRRG
jgi:FHA domain